MADTPPAPTSGLTPYLTIRDSRGPEAIDFYVAAFGAEVAYKMPAQDGKRLMHAHLLVNGCSVMISDDFPEYTGRTAPEPAGVTIHLKVEDADAVWEKAVAAGATATQPLADQFWGDRYGQLKDPFGHSWSIGAPIKG